MSQLHIDLLRRQLCISLCRWFPISLVKIKGGGERRPGATERRPRRSGLNIRPQYVLQGGLFSRDGEQGVNNSHENIVDAVFQILMDRNAFVIFSSF